MPKIHFTKMHGCGNDYIYVDTMQYPIADPVQASILWSDRHKGIGSDGLVLIGASPIPEADYSMRIFNADGSEAMMCGNASRCIGKYLYERGLTPNPSPRGEGSDMFFDLREGQFCTLAPTHRDFLQPDDARRIHILMRMDFPTMHLYRLSRQERNRIIDVLLQYYRLHIPQFPELKSLAVLQELWA